jgi:predicted nucleic acid-binding protein
VITAVDTSVLLDVILDDPSHRAPSVAALRRARGDGALIVCPVVWAEVRAALTRPDAIGEVFANAGIAFDPFDQKIANLAGDLWRVYRRQGGKRTSLVPDFLVGAHAIVRAGRILSRDRGFLRNYFEGLTVVDPGAAPVKRR